MSVFHLNPTSDKAALALQAFANPKAIDQTGWLRDTGEAIHAGEMPLPTATIILVGPSLNDLIVYQDRNGCQFSYEIGDTMASFYFFKTTAKDVLKRVRAGRLAFKVKRVMNPVQGGAGEWYRPLASVLV